MTCWRCLAGLVAQFAINRYVFSLTKTFWLIVVGGVQECNPNLWLARSAMQDGQDWLLRALGFLPPSGQWRPSKHPKVRINAHHETKVFNLYYMFDTKVSFTYISETEVSIRTKS
ncbi:hypothetical protein ACTMU2_20705 [Cupriavidus basilensis]